LLSAPEPCCDDVVVSRRVLSHDIVDCCVSQDSGRFQLRGLMP